MSAQKYITFHDGPHQGELRDLNGKEAVFTGMITQGQDRKVTEANVSAKLRIRDSFVFYSVEGIKLYQVEAEALGDALFRKGERVVFEYDAVAQQSKEIYLF